MKQIRLNALDMNCMGCTPGIWTHPRDETGGYNTLRYWTELAKVLERGKFDSIFIADILGVYDVYGGNADAAFTHAVEFPVNDPFLLVPAMAMVTEHLGFGITGTLSYEPPFTLARTLSTLDHLTNGRMAWNIVTGYLDSAAKAFGQSKQLAHDDRYAMGEEYMEVMYKLWEGSWEDDAVVRDKTNRIFARAEKIHKVKHSGKHFELDAYHLCEPSPQRTPILFQAGASTRGREFASKHAECMFISGFSFKAVAKIVADIRRRTAANGRDPSSVIIYTALTVICGKTDGEAQAKYEDYRKYVNLEGTLTLFSGYSGFDLSGSDLDAPYKYVESDAIQTFVEGFTSANPDKVWTLREVGEFLGIGGFAAIEIGSPETISDRMTQWMEETGIDGFNLIYSVSPGDFTDFVDLVVPELQRRGLYKTDYEQGTLREKLYGGGRTRLPDDHPAANYRFKSPATETIRAQHQLTPV
ncbi:MAG: LLM class flavin-dependent oxidoreductase [Verrucomicrobiota bacterium]|nr:LLM class flavin-dependent oxidoreductase [Verrucomicrobiota bacterium]